MKNRRKQFIIISLFFVMLFFSYGFEVVQDPIMAMHTTMKTAIDKIYQAAKLDFDAEDIGLSTEQLAELKNTLQQCKEIYKMSEQIYDTATTIKDHVGDPMALARYLNKEFTKSDDLTSLLNITDSVMRLDPENLKDLGYAFNFALDLVSEADSVFGGNQFETATKVNAENAKKAAVVEEMVNNASKQSIETLKSMDEVSKGVSASSTVSSILYGAFQGICALLKTTTTLGTETGEHHRNVSNYIAGENQKSQSDVEHQAKIVTENDKAQEAGLAYMKEKSAVARTNDFFDKTDIFK